MQPYVFMRFKIINLNPNGLLEPHRQRLADRFRLRWLLKLLIALLTFFSCGESQPTPPAVFTHFLISNDGPGN
jgi:hypothetical protein